MLTAVKDSEDKVDVTGPSHQHLLVEKERVVSTFITYVYYLPRYSELNWMLL